MKKALVGWLFVLVILFAGCAPATFPPTEAPTHTPEPTQTATPPDSAGNTPTPVVTQTPTPTPTVVPTPEPTPEPTLVPTPEPTVEPRVEPQSKGEVVFDPGETEYPYTYYTRIDVTNNVVTVYERDEDGKFSVITQQFICSVGLPASPTPLGVFPLIGQVATWGYFPKYKVSAQYLTRIKGPYLFHSVLYKTADESTLIESSWWNLGNAASKGCIRMVPEDVKWIYYNLEAGSSIEVFKGEANPELTKSLLPGPLPTVKPKATKAPTVTQAPTVQPTPAVTPVPTTPAPVDPNQPAGTPAPAAWV